MPWSGSGSFSRTNSVHTGSTTWAQDLANGDKIIATRHDTHDQDLSDGIQSCLAKNGENVPTADLPMATYKHTNVGVAAARTQYARASQVQDSAFVWGGTASGSSSAFTFNLTPAITAYATGQRFAFIANHSVTGATTLNVNSVGAKAVVLPDGSTAMTADMIVNGSVVEVIYDGTSFRLLNTIRGAGTAAAMITSLGNTVRVGFAGPAGLVNSGGVVTDTTITGMSVALTLTANESVALVSVVPVSISSAGVITIRHFRDAVRCTADTYCNVTPATTATTGTTDTATLVSYDTPGAGSYTYTTKWTNDAGTAYSNYPTIMRFVVKSS